MTYFSIVLGELVPNVGTKPPRGSRERRRPSASLAEPYHEPLREVAFVFHEFVLKVLRLDKGEEAGVTQEEIHAMIEEGSASGAIEESERDMVRNVFRLDERQVGSVMTPEATSSGLIYRTAPKKTSKNF